MFRYRSAGRCLVGLCALGLSMLVARSADASIIQLSTHSTNSVDPAMLDATVNFQVSGSQLLITVTNDTVAPNGFRINEILFNATSELTSLTAFILPAGWNLNTDEGAGPFGSFEFSLSTGTGIGAPSILPGQSKQFTLDFTGVGVTDATFLTELSTNSSRSPMIVAARFIHGPPGSGNAFGGINVIPEPGTAALLLIAYAISLKGRRREAAAIRRALATR